MRQDHINTVKNFKMTLKEVDVLLINFGRLCMLDRDKNPKRAERLIDIVSTLSLKAVTKPFLIKGEQSGKKERI